MPIERIRFLGHSATFFESDKFVIGIDPWLSGNPVCPAIYQNPERLDYIVLTHGHVDHAGDTPRLAELCGSTVIAAYELAMILIEEGVPQEKVIPVNKGGTVTIGEVNVTLVHAIHSNSYDGKNGTKYAGEACGVILRDGKNSIYHSGDTCFFSDMKLIGEMYAPSIGLFCVGDRFTMGPVEAAMAAGLVGCQMAVPVHHSTFGLLTGTPAEFVNACKELAPRTEVVALSPGDFITVKA